MIHSLIIKFDLSAAKHFLMPFDQKASMDYTATSTSELSLSIWTHSSIIINASLLRFVTFGDNCNNQSSDVSSIKERLN